MTPTLLPIPPLLINELQGLSLPILSLFSLLTFSREDMFTKKIYRLRDSWVGAVVAITSQLNKVDSGLKKSLYT